MDEERLWKEKETSPYAIYLGCGIAAGVLTLVAILLGNFYLLIALYPIALIAGIIMVRYPTYYEVTTKRIKGKSGLYKTM